VKTAIRWAKAHATEYHGDANRIALIGYSAGGHVVCLAALAEAPVEDVVLTYVRFSAAKGMRIVNAKGIRFVNCSISVRSGPAISVSHAEVTGLDFVSGR
jgi:acetyl esterase/lipase